MDSSIKERIEQDIHSNEIMLYMKGTKEQPMCGFSAQVIHILNDHNVNYHTANVLDDWDLREGVKEFSNWPTVPQLYVKGKFIGGCDIIMQLQRNNELSALIKG